MEFMIFDCETTGLPKNWRAPVTQTDNWPRIVQLAWNTYNSDYSLISSNSRIILPEGFSAPKDATKIHGITTELAREKGHLIAEVLKEFQNDLSKAQARYAHNADFDGKVIGAEYLRQGLRIPFDLASLNCTMKLTVDYCAIPGKHGNKWPTLEELYETLFGESFTGAHDALIDVEACAKCVFELFDRGLLKANYSC